MVQLRMCCRSCDQPLNSSDDPLLHLETAASMSEDPFWLELAPSLLKALLVIYSGFVTKMFQKDASAPVLQNMANGYLAVDLFPPISRSLS